MTASDRIWSDVDNFPPSFFKFLNFFFEGCKLSKPPMTWNLISLAGTGWNVSHAWLALGKKCLDKPYITLLRAHTGLRTVPAPTWQPWPNNKHQGCHIEWIKCSPIPRSTENILHVQQLNEELREWWKVSAAVKGILMQTSWAAWPMNRSSLKRLYTCTC